MVRIGIIGVGRQGGKYLKYFERDEIQGACLTAVCDLNEDRMTELDGQGRWAHFTKYEELLRSGSVDAVIIDTPHYLHPVIAAEAVRCGISVLSDKPLGVDVRTIRKIEPELQRSTVTFGVLFNQRMRRVFRRIKEVLERGELGTLKRCIWEITDWYRPQKYYDLGGWRSSWRGEGGGVLINQCVHNIDMLCYLFGAPDQIRSMLGYGAYHRTVVDDSVVANLIYPNGFVCTLISSTGETPGTNRLEISGTKGRLLFDEFNKLKFAINQIPEDVFSETATSDRYKIKFGKPKTQSFVETFEADVDDHKACIQDFVTAVQNSGQPAADYDAGLLCAEVINGIYYSDWVGKTVSIPVDKELFYDELCSRWEKE